MILRKRKEVYYGGRHFFTGTGPILILTTYDSLNDPKLIEKLVVKGIKKFIGYEVKATEHYLGSAGLTASPYGMNLSILIYL